MKHRKVSKDERRLIRLAEVQRLSGLSRTGIYARMADRTFPQRVPLGGRAVGWVEEEVHAWVAARIEQREAAA